MKRMICGVLLASATFVAAPAYADITIVPASSIQGDNVLFNSGVQTGSTVTGKTQSGTLVNFTGTTTAGNILRAQGGQARVEGALDVGTGNPNDTYDLTSLFFDLADGKTFNNLEFNLFGASSGATASFSLIDDGGQTFTFNNLALGNGSNMFGFLGINGQSIASASFTVNGTIQDVRQIRLDEVVATAVPEPASWAMMIGGFGLLGGAMRRRKTRVSSELA